MGNLYEITNAIANFEPEVDEETGELLNADLLDRLIMERDLKIESIALFIKNLDALICALEREKKKIEERIESAKRKLNSLKRYLASLLGGEKFESAKCKISYRKSEAVEVSESFEEWAKKNAPDLLTETVSVTANKTAIKEALKSGKTVEGARIVENQNMILK